MVYSEFSSNIPATISVSETEICNNKEYCFSIIPNSTNNFSNQLSTIADALQEICSFYNLKQTHARFSRFFISDCYNQEEELRNSIIFTDFLHIQSTSIIEQFSCNSAKVTALIKFRKNNSCVIKKHEKSIEYFEDNFFHMWHCNLHSSKKESVHHETLHILESYEMMLRKQNASIENNCLRTWFFMRDIDNSYEQMVKARKEYFTCIGLNKKTHYIASTGIEGRSSKQGTYIHFDGYAIKNIFPQQIQYLYAKDYLNATHEYGVTFERGTAIHYETYSHIFISGTASINNMGTILFPKSIELQTKRVFENIHALLFEAESSLIEVQYFIIYLRDATDYSFVKNYMQQHYTNVPFTIVQAPVCRPGWLIEIECEAISIKE